jgi:hypothetical protein
MSGAENWLKGLRVPGNPDEFECKGFLKSNGIRVPEGVLLESSRILSGLPDDPGLKFPLAAKVCDPAILHKTDRGGVSLRLTEDIWRDEVLSLAERFPGSNILLEEMVPYKGVEFIIGALVDPVFGPAVMFGAGGVLTELYSDVTFRLAPLSAREARRMVREPVISRLLEGYRGIEMGPEALAETIAAVGDLAVSLGPAFSQLDINPVVYDGINWVALDALVMLRQGTL